MIFSKSSLSKDYCTFISVIFLIVTCICGWSTWSSYRSKLEVHNHQLHIELENIDSALTESLNYILYLMGFLSNQISLNGGNLEYILSLYSGFNNDFKVKDLSSWSMFDWLNPQKQIILTSSHGILKEPVDLSNRINLKYALNEPGKIFFNKPDFGKISNHWVIPVSTAVASAPNKTVYGIINIGVSVTALTKKIEQALTEKHFNYVLLTYDGELITKSPDPNDSDKLLDRLHFQSLLRNTDFFTKTEIKATHSRLYHHDTVYTFFKKSDKYPFIIGVGHPKTLKYTYLWQSLTLQAIPILLIGMIFSIVLYYFRKRLVSPILALSRSAEQISTGDLNTAIPESNSLEAKTLGKSLQHIKDLIFKEQQIKEELKQTYSQLKQLNEHLEERVIERTSELNQALRSRSQFINNISHEVRRPIHIIYNSLEALHNYPETVEEPQRQHLLDLAFQNAEELVHLVGTIIDLSLFQAGRMSFSMEEYYFSPIIQDTLELFESLNTEHKHLHLQYKNESESTIVRCDRDAIQKVIKILLVNAIKYTARGTLYVRTYLRPIHYADGTEKPGIAFSLTDEGVGIPEEELQSIFHPFAQSKRTYTGAGGKGLGLSISAEIIHSHKGQIWAQNNLDKGATFTFVLPVLETHS